MGKLDGKCGIVTGAAGGLGGGFARALIAEGASLELWDLESPDPAALGVTGAASGRAVDVSDAARVSDAMAAAHDDLGGLDFFVNNAGIRTEVPFLEQTPEDWRRTLDVNLTGTFLCSQAAARIMVDHGGGRIVNIASISGIVAFTTRAAYVASKAGVMGLTRAIATELGGRGIVCNAVAPGITETPLTSHFFDDEALATQIREGHPARRWGQIDDLAGAVVFLCGPDSAFVQGATLVVDGGWTIGKGY